MDSIHKMPFLLGGFMAVVTGLISYISGKNSQTLYIRMAVVMVVFFILGNLIKRTLITINEELEKKKEQELLEMEKQEAEMSAQMQVDPQLKPDNEHKINLVADDSEDDFSPLNVSRIITSKLKE